MVHNSIDTALIISTESEHAHRSDFQIFMVFQNPLSNAIT